MIFLGATHTSLFVQLALFVLTGAGLLLARPYFQARGRREQEQIRSQHWQALQLGMQPAHPQQPIWGLPAQQ